MLAASPITIQGLYSKLAITSHAAKPVVPTRSPYTAGAECHSNTSVSIIIIIILLLLFISHTNSWPLSFCSRLCLKDQFLEFDEV